MTPLDKFLSELKSLEQAATRGPWMWGPGNRKDQLFDGNADSVLYVTIYEDVGGKEADQDFIAASRTAIPKLIAMVEEMRHALSSIGCESIPTSRIQTEIEWSSKAVLFDTVVKDTIIARKALARAEEIAGGNLAAKRGHVADK